MNKRAIAPAVIVILALVVIGLIFYFSFGSKSLTDGRVVVTLTDAAANMGSVSSVQITVNQISAHSETEGWVTISSTPRTYDLLQLKSQNKQVILADTEIKEGTYTQVRLDISKVAIIDSNGTHEAKLPSQELKIEGNLVVEPNATVTVKFDFIADESLHITGNGKYIFAPVVQFETREDAQVNVKSDSSVEINGGTVKTNAKVGMDVDGNVGVGLKIPSNANVNLGSNGQLSLDL